MSEKKVDPIVQVLHEKRQADDEIVTLASGVRVKLHPVSSILVQDILGRLPTPEVPIWHNPDTDRDEENPLNPEYKKALREQAAKITQYMTNAYILFGMELVDPVPDKESWLKNVKRMERLGAISLQDYDLQDPDDLEYLYKRYIAAPTEPEIELITSMSRLTAEEVAQARASFRGDAGRKAD